MISLSHDIHEFMNAVKGKNELEAIYLAEQEALKVWRRSYKKTNASDDKRNDISMTYQNDLLRFINFVRYGKNHDKLFCGKDRLFRSFL